MNSIAQLEIGLNAAIVSVNNYQPQILAVRSLSQSPPKWDGLPFGPFSPAKHRTLEIGLRSWVRELTGLELGYVEQLYSFGDRGRHTQPGDVGPHIVSIGYLALTRTQSDQDYSGGIWRDWYSYFPWEDWRDGKPKILIDEIEPRLLEWSRRPDSLSTPERPLKRRERTRICFDMDGTGWDEEKVLDRYELLYEAGLLAEAGRDGRNTVEQWDELPVIGKPMQFDHRRILATALGRLRAKIKYRPVVFELMTENFTLFEFQKTVEAISGRHLHKQNFRRLVENAGLVEATGDVSTKTGGRPAKLFRFRRNVLLERPSPGVGVKSR